MIYKPSDNLYEVISNLFQLEICPWDDYYMRMAQSDFLLNRHKKKSSKSYFIRKAPFGGSYAILGGLTAFLRTLRDFRFNDIVCEALKDQNYNEKFIHFLKIHLQRVKVNVYSIPEGGMFFPNEPTITIEGDLISVRIAEGILLKDVNYPSLAMTKWHRVVTSATPGLTLEFARRRAQDPLRTTLYAHLAGVNFSSNSDVRKGANIKIVGTMGHEWIQSFGDEFKAFDKWLECNPDKPVLLVDTIDTLKSGVPNAIKAFKKHRDKIKEADGIPGVRNDSGDLAFITIEERCALDNEGLQEVLIFQTNDLDEYSIQTIREQIFTHATRAGLNPENVLQRIVWACGTNNSL